MFDIDPINLDFQGLDAASRGRNREQSIQKKKHGTVIPRPTALLNFDMSQCWK